MNKIIIIGRPNSNEIPLLCQRQLLHTPAWLTWCARGLGRFSPGRTGHAGAMDVRQHRWSQLKPAEAPPLKGKQLGRRKEGYCPPPHSIAQQSRLGWAWHPTEDPAWVVSTVISNSVPSVEASYLKSMGLTAVDGFLMMESWRILDL
jgi:hypothetical protein